MESGLRDAAAPAARRFAGGDGSHPTCASAWRRILLFVKEGAGERVVNGRPFTDLTLDGLRDLLARADFETLELIGSHDDRPAQAGERWVSAVSRRPVTDSVELA